MDIGIVTSENRLYEAMSVTRQYKIQEIGTMQ